VCSRVAIRFSDSEKAKPLKKAHCPNECWMAATVWTACRLNDGGRCRAACAAMVSWRDPLRCSRWEQWESSRKAGSSLQCRSHNDQWRGRRRSLQELSREDAARHAANRRGPQERFGV
jgi:hypothetical protein